MYKLFGKRCLDSLASFIGLLLLFPLLLLIAIWIKTSSAGSVFYTQYRVGKNFKPFKLYKFRSMTVGADKKGLSITSANDTRITKVGKIIRKYKIDELPQLLNVLKGDMSLVGPRPEVERYVNLKRQDYTQILKVKPGITDNAAIAFRNEEEILAQYQDKEKAYIEIILPKKIELYQQYIGEMSFVKDIQLILKTIKVI